MLSVSIDFGLKMREKDAGSLANVHVKTTTRTTFKLVLVNLPFGKLGAKERDKRATSSAGNDFGNANLCPNVLIFLRLP